MVISGKKAFLPSLITNYRNPGVHTVEDELESAIFKAGGMLPENLGELQKVLFEFFFFSSFFFHQITPYLIDWMET